MMFFFVRVAAKSYTRAFPVQVSSSMTCTFFGLTVTDLSVKELRLRHEALINSCADAIYTLTVDGTITTWNPAAERLYGYRSQEAVGRRIHVLVPPEQQEEISSILSRVTHGETFHRETVRVCKAGKSIDVALSVSPIQSSDGNVEGISVIARDITDRKRIEGGLKERLAEIEALYDNAPIGLSPAPLNGRHPPRPNEGSGGVPGTGLCQRNLQDCKKTGEPM